MFLLRTQVSKLQLHVGHLMEEISTRDQEIHDRDMEIQARDESIAQLREENSRLAAAAQHAAQLQQHQQHVAYAQPAPAVQCFSISPTSQHPTHHPMASSSGGYASPRAAHPAPAAQPMSPMAMQGVQEEIKCLQLKLELVRWVRRGCVQAAGTCATHACTLARKHTHARTRARTHACTGTSCSTMHGAGQWAPQAPQGATCATWSRS